MWMDVLLEMRNRKAERKINQNYSLISSFQGKNIFSGTEFICAGKE